MLMVFRIVLPAAFTPGVPRGLGRAVIGAGVVGAVCMLEGVRRPVLGSGVWGPSLESGIVGMAPVLFLVFVVGIAGNAVEGGPIDGLEGRGMVAGMLMLSVIRRGLYVCEIKQ